MFTGDRIEYGIEYDSDITSESYERLSSGIVNKYSYHH